jgi:hypothetical protein
MVMSCTYRQGREREEEGPNLESKFEDGGAGGTGSDGAVEEGQLMELGAWMLLAKLLVDHVHLDEGVPL